MSAVQFQPAVSPVEKAPESRTAVAVPKADSQSVSALSLTDRFSNTLRKPAVGDAIVLAIGSGAVGAMAGMAWRSGIRGGLVGAGTGIAAVTAIKFGVN